MKKESCLKEEREVFKRDKGLAEAWVLPCCSEEEGEEDFAHIGITSFTHGICHAKKLHSPVPHQDDSVYKGPPKNC